MDPHCSELKHSWFWRAVSPSPVWLTGENKGETVGMVKLVYSLAERKCGLCYPSRWDGVPWIWRDQRVQQILRQGLHWGGGRWLCTGGEVWEQREVLELKRQDLMKTRERDGIEALSTLSFPTGEQVHLYLKGAVVGRWWFSFLIESLVFKIDLSSDGGQSRSGMERELESRLRWSFPRWDHKIEVGRFKSPLKEREMICPGEHIWPENPHAVKAVGWIPVCRDMQETNMRKCNGFKVL